MSECPTVRVAQGALRGRRVRTGAGGAYASFQGVPYARPPVGPLRFQVAEPAESWEGTRDALKEGPSCPQIDWLLRRPYLGDEDCLYLNVYTPKIPAEDSDVKLPVMVWIHGGGFQVGSGDAELYGPDHLVGEDVVIVTTNYRVGVLGFLSLEDEAQPDNIGLKDQVAALRWVKHNIAAFGGDPDNVTIFGESAGGASVHYQLLSPMSKGLFHKAILQSGCALNRFAVANKPKEHAFAMAKMLGCEAADVQELLNFLKTLPAKELIEGFEKLYTLSEGANPQRFGPVAEKHVKPEEEVFLPAHPKEIMDNGQFHSVPCMVGITSKEGIIVLAVGGVFTDPSILKTIGPRLMMHIPEDLNSTSNRDEITERVKKFYFGNGEIMEKSINGFVDFMSDTMVVRGVDQTVNTLGRSTSPVFYYYFDFDGKLNVYKHFVGASDISGASHFDEIGYLFATPFFKVPDVAPYTREGLARRRMVKLWTNFAKTGNPTPAADPVLRVQWPPYTPESPRFLSISDTLSVRKDLLKERISFWESL